MNRAGMYGQKLRKFEIYDERGDIVATARGYNPREVAREWLKDHPDARSCSVGEPSTAATHGFAKSDGFDENPNRMRTFDPSFTGLF